MSFLDVSIRGQIMRLLIELRQRYGMTMVFVSHDLKVVGDLCDRMAVLLQGTVVEQGPVTQLRLIIMIRLFRETRVGRQFVAHLLYLGNQSFECRLLNIELL